METMKHIIICILLASAAWSQDDPFKPEPLPKPVIKEIAPGILQVGTVKLIKKTREVHLPVTIEMHEGPIEYLVVTGRGKYTKACSSPPPSLTTFKWQCCSSTPKAAEAS